MRFSCSWKISQQCKLNRISSRKWTRQELQICRPQLLWMHSKVMDPINLASCTVIDNWMKTLNIQSPSNLRSKSMSFQMICHESWLKDKSFWSTTKNKGSCLNSRMMSSGNFQRSSRKNMTFTRKNLIKRRDMKWTSGPDLLIDMLQN